LDVAMREELDMWQELNAAHETETPAKQYVVQNLMGREYVAATRLVRADVEKMVLRFLNAEAPALLAANDQIAAAIAEKEAEKATSGNGNGAGNGNGSTSPSKPRGPKTEFSSDQAGAFYIRHGIWKNQVKFCAYWAKTKKYVRREVVATTERGSTYHPQIVAASQELLIAAMKKAFPNAEFDGSVIESNEV